MAIASRTRLIVVPLVLLLATAAGPAWADSASCRKLLVSQLLKLEKTHLVAHEKCLDAENIAKIPGPCPDATTQAKIATIRAKVAAKVAAACTTPDIVALGFASCDLEPGASGREAQCAAMPITDAASVVGCLACWKEAELSEFMATLYASHAEDVCSGDLGPGSGVCSPLDCTTPLPDQRDLGDTGENDCQKAIGKAGVKHLLFMAKTLGKCGIKGLSEATCRADLAITTKLAQAGVKLTAAIHNKCGNRDPSPATPFCCRFGMGNACVAAATRDDCETLGGSVQNGKTCGGSNTCDPAMGGNQLITWWATCPQSNTCPGTTLATLDDLIGCVDSSAGEIADQLLCWQLPGGGWVCPSPSGAFLD